MSEEERIKRREEFRTLNREFARKNITKLTQAFHENDDRKIRKYMLRLMGLSSAKDLEENPRKLIELYGFSKEEIIEITGSTNAKEGEEKIIKVIHEVIDDGSFARRSFGDDLLFLSLLAN